MANDLLHKTTKQFLWEQESKEFYCDAIKMPDIKTKSENFLSNNLPQTEEGVKKNAVDQFTDILRHAAKSSLRLTKQKQTRKYNIGLAKNGLTRTAG